MVANFPSRALHDVGLAAWFGGTLANAVSLNRAAGVAYRADDAGRVTNAGWGAWTPVNAAAIGAHVVGAKVSADPDVPVASGTEPIATTPTEVAGAQKQLKILQWAIPALTGALVVLTAYAGEQQRPAAVKTGVAQRLLSRK